MKSYLTAAAAVAALIAAPSAASAKAKAETGGVAPNTPLYCEDSAGKVSPVAASFGAMLEAYRQAYDWPRQSVADAETASGPSKIMVFGNAGGVEENMETMAYTLTPHEDGWAFRSYSLSRSFGETHLVKGTELCETIARVLEARKVR